MMVSSFILYMNTIKPIQQNNIYKVNPVNLIENRKQNDRMSLFERQDNNIFNLNHPKVSGSETQARSLDFLA